VGSGQRTVNSGKFAVNSGQWRLDRGCAIRINWAMDI
jgi:hypothetical protein